VARQLQPVTRLARLILDSGKPAYVVGGEVGINYNRLLDYADGRMAIPSAHRAKLTRYFGADPEGVDATVDATQSSFTDTVFSAEFHRAKVAPGGDMLVVLRVPRWLHDDVTGAWALNDAAGLVLDVRAVDEGTGRPARFSATVDDVTVRAGDGLFIRLLVPAEDRDAALQLSSNQYPKRFRFRPWTPPAKQFFDDE
jgi:hypothetical protein